MKDRQMQKREPLTEPEGAEPDWIVATLDDVLAEQDARHAQLLLHRLADWQGLYQTNTRLASIYDPASRRRAAGWWETERAWSAFTRK